MNSKSIEKLSEQIAILTHTCFQDLKIQVSLQKDSSSEYSPFTKTTAARRQGFKNTWTYQQNLAYLNFLSQHLLLFSLPVRQRKEIGIHVMMSKQIKTRNSLQCRSHHQKMLKKFQAVQRIVSMLKNQLKKQERDHQKTEACNSPSNLQVYNKTQMINYDEIEPSPKEESLWERVIKKASLDFLND